MNSKGEELNISKQERLEDKEKKRKKNLEQMLLNKRISKINQKEQAQQIDELTLKVKEVKEINNEENKMEETKDLILNNKNINLELSKEKSKLFLTKEKRLLELNNLSHSKSFNSSNKESFKSEGKKENSKNNKSSLIEEEYEYLDNENIDYIEEQQKNILEEMFLDVNHSESENKIELYLDIINLDETKQKVWSYKCYEEICLIYIKNEQHELFLKYYIKLRETAHSLEDKDIPIYIKYTAEKFVEEVTKQTKESINHWLEDICKDFNIFQKDKIINIFEAKFNLSFLILANKIKAIVKEKKDVVNKNIEKEENKFDINVIDYMRDKQKLEELTNKYLIEECGCEPKYLDSKGNTFFYYSPPNSMRGGEKYNAPIGWTGFGIEVLNRYGNSDWLGKEGK